MTSPLLWYLNRGTGVVLLVAFTATVVLGVLATGRSATPLWPRFVTQGLHRSLAALSVLMLTAHVVSAVVDSYVDIRWWQAFVPFGSTYEPVWLALGAISLDLLAVVIATRSPAPACRTGSWFLVHLTTYAAWTSAVVHGLFIGTDSEGGLDGGDHGQLRRGGRVGRARPDHRGAARQAGQPQAAHNDGPRRPYGPQSGVERAERHGAAGPGRGRQRKERVMTAR